MGGERPIKAGGEAADRGLMRMRDAVVVGLGAFLLGGAGVAVLAVALVYPVLAALAHIARPSAL